MRDASQVEWVVERCIEVSRTFWGIDPAWRIDFKLEELELDTPACCDHEADYRKALITLDANQCKDLSKVWEHVAHEVIHVLLSDMDLYAQAAEFGKRYNPVLSRVRIHVLERTTSLLEQVFVRERPCEAWGVLVEEPEMV
jgi:hypothetical protein